MFLSFPSPAPSLLLSLSPPSLRAHGHTVFQHRLYLQVGDVFEVAFRLRKPQRGNICCNYVHLGTKMWSILCICSSGKQRRLWSLVAPRVSGSNGTTSLLCWDNSSCGSPRDWNIKWAVKYRLPLKRTLRCCTWLEVLVSETKDML